MNRTELGYKEKPVNYFSGARRSFVDRLPKSNAARMLEIGCGNGDTAAYSLASGKVAWCAGIELCAEPAAAAARVMNVVLIGDVETIDLPFPLQHFDILLMSEVVEHLREPWLAVSRLYPLLKPGALVLAGSPNVSHHSVVRKLLKGRWDYESMGIMDRTHLRWFTPRSYRELFESCGFETEYAGPANPLRFKASVFNFLTLGMLQHLLHSQICYIGHKPGP